MPLWSRGSYAAEGSLNYFLFANLSAVTASLFTAWVTAPEESAHLRFDYLDAPLNPPCFSVTHLDAERDRPDLSYGRVVSPTGGRGGWVRHLSEVSVWHSRYSGGASSGLPRPGWEAQLRQMRDMVAYLFESAHYAPLLDLDVATAAPFTTAGLLRFSDLREVGTPPDPNPAFVRRRLLLSWGHLESV